MKRINLRMLAATLCLGITIAVAVPAAAMYSTANTSGYYPPNADVACEDILKSALEQLHNVCDGIGRNRACYGNNQITALPSANHTLKFDAVGDIAPIQSISSLVTSPLDIEKGTWGVSLLKLQANLPDTLPGQNVTFLLYGNTTLNNISGDMQAFYFSSSLSDLKCKTIPESGIVVRSPNHTKISFTANGVKITIASSIVLHAQAHKTLKVGLLEGHAEVTAAGKTETLQSGQSVSVQLGGNDGLEAVSQPSVPAAEPTETSLQPVVESANTLSNSVTSDMTVEGCVTEKSGNTIVISGTTIKLDDNSALVDNAKVGQCYYIEGNVVAQPDGSTVLEPLVVTRTDDDSVESATAEPTEAIDNAASNTTGGESVTPTETPTVTDNGETNSSIDGGADGGTDGGGTTGTIDGGSGETPTYVPTPDGGTDSGNGNGGTGDGGGVGETPTATPDGSTDSGGTAADITGTLTGASDGGGSGSLENSSTPEAPNVGSEVGQIIVLFTHVGYPRISEVSFLIASMVNCSSWGSRSVQPILARYDIPPASLRSRVGNRCSGFAFLSMH